jgi:ribonuclease P protein component
MLDGFPVVMRLRPLKGYDAFGNVFRTGRRFSNGKATAMVVFRPPISVSEPAIAITEQQIVYFGVTARKRTRPAVLRNRIKRLLRESIRQIADEQHRTKPFPFREIVVVWNAVPSRPSLLGLETVLEAVRDVLDRAAEYYLRE